MNRKEKIALLNGILKGETPIAAVFNEWPERIFYELPDDDDHYKNEDGEIVSFEEVDKELMSYPKVRIVYQDHRDEDIKLSIGHKYTDGRDYEPDSPDTGGGFSCPIKPKKEQKAEKPSNPDPPPDVIHPPSPPGPFLSRKDREVMAQGSLYCVR